MFGLTFIKLITKLMGLKCLVCYMKSVGLIRVRIMFLFIICVLNDCEMKTIL